MRERPEAEIGVFGGSGFYDFLEDVTYAHVHTPFGPPSARVAIGTLGERRVAFLPRHGAHHEYPPHRVNFRANVWAMRELGVVRLIGPCACGSLRPDLHPGDVVICDQLVDRTRGRDDTYFDGGVVGHVGFADPYCPTLRAALINSAREVAGAGAGAPFGVHDTGTVVVIQGPRFSTRAESRWFGQMGWDVVNMTQYPEAVLARELGICYATLALVTDYDVGVEGRDGIEPVSMPEVFRVLGENVEKTRQILFAAIPSISGPAEACGCRSALDSGPLGPRGLMGR